MKNYRCHDRLFWFWTKYSPPFFGDRGYVFLRGFFSGYPICCIVFFIRFVLTDNWENYIEEYATDGYVPCPKCIKEKSK